MSRCFLSALTLVALLACGLPTRAATGPQETSRQVDRLLTVELIGNQQGKPAAKVDDETFLRRVYLDLNGVVPTPEAVIAFTLDPDPQKRQREIDRLLGHPKFGQAWASYWRDVIFYRRSEDRSQLAMPALQAYLTEQLNANTPWDELASSFITSKGNVREEGHTGLIMAQGGRPEDTVAEISRIFMGVQIQCAQCHDHPTDRWKREQFHELAAFFPRVAIRPNRNNGQIGFSVVAEDTPRSFRGAGNNNNRYQGTREHRMPDLDDPSSEGELMTPVFFATGQKLRIGTRDADRRGQLATWLTSADNPWFAKAFVNRIWAEMVGEGFYEPVDDMGPDRDCSAPETLDYLAQSFIDSNYDVQGLFRTIANTDAYQRGSRQRRQAGEMPFLATCAQPLRADQIYSNLLTALQMRDPSRGPSAPRGNYGGYGSALRTLLNREFGYDPSSPREDVVGSIPQALLMMNSPFINQAISARQPQGLGKLLREIKDDEELAVELYLRALAREPGDAELKTCLDYVREVGSREEAFEDLLWALVNSAEFLHRR